MSDQDHTARARQIALAIALGFALVKLLFCSLQSLTGDEAYGLVIGRSLELSYFDHPPLHQWIAHFAALVFGENEWVRAPFILLFAGASWLIFLTTEILFGAEAGIVAVFCLNASWDMLDGSGSQILPTVPLMFSFSLATWALTRICFCAVSRRAEWLMWLCVGLALGLAALSKYHAVFLVLGIALFLIASPRQRLWFKQPAPYVAALLGLAMSAPVLIWNAQHGWASFRFQAERLALIHTATPYVLHSPYWPTPLDPLAPFAILWALAGKLTPWIFVPLLLASAEAVGTARTDERRLLLLCLGGPMIAWFVLAPAFGVTAGIGWSLPGFFFLYPLVGDWILRKAGLWNINLGKVAAATALVLGLTLLVVASNDKTGWIGAKIPFMENAAQRFTPGLAFPHLAQNEMFSDGEDFHPAFVVSQMDYSSSAKLAVALGPRLPVLSVTDSHGLYFLYDQSSWIGEDGVIVGQREDAEVMRASFSPWFESIDAPIIVSVPQTRWTQRPFVLMRAHGLKKPFPFALM